MIELLNRIENRLKFRPSYYLLFAILNGAVLMNFHNYLFKHSIGIVFLFCFVIYTIYKPKNWISVIGSCLFSVYYLLDFFPRIGNHSSIILFTSLTILLLFIFKLFSKKEVLNSKLLAYFFRIFTVTVYFYTGFHKLNTDYFNTCVSCVNEINEYTLSNIFGFPIKIGDSLSRFFQIIALIVECIVPFGIMHYKTRSYSVLLLLLFHSYLSLSVFADFSAVGLFLLLGCFIDFESNSFSKKTIFYIRLYLIMIMISVISPIFLSRISVQTSVFPFIKGFIFLVGYLSFFIYFFRNHDAKRYSFRRSYFMPLFILCISISFWTLKGYIGLGNAGNLTMFSNLVTEKSMNNHLLIDTKKTKLFNFEEDNVYIIKMDNPNIKENYTGYKLPIVEFRFLVKYWSKKFDKPIPCILVYKNKKYTFKDIKTSEFKNSKWWYKYLNFRKIQTTSPNECRW